MSYLTKYFIEVSDGDDHRDLDELLTQHDYAFYEVSRSGLPKTLAEIRAVLEDTPE